MKKAFRRAGIIAFIICGSLSGIMGLWGAYIVLAPLVRGQADTLQLASDKAAALQGLHALCLTIDKERAEKWRAVVLVYLPTDEAKKICSAVAAAHTKVDPQGTYDAIADDAEEKVQHALERHIAATGQYLGLRNSAKRIMAETTSMRRLRQLAELSQDLHCYRYKIHCCCDQAALARTLHELTPQQAIAQETMQLR